jgi:N-formylglutamate deformylase
MEAVYTVQMPKAPPVPIVLSIPHAGTYFSPDLAAQFKPDLIAAPVDTDWFVTRLYEFAPALGITVIAANYSRWVIDLNRDPDSKPLYTDGRIITALCPTTDFLGYPLYRDERPEVDPREVHQRVDAYFLPYHQKLRELVDNCRHHFGTVLLWDAHSICRHVPTISSTPFPDLILGDADETSADTDLIECAWTTLRASSYRVAHNDPFKGGYITRHYGKPEYRQHALQLEMTKVNYMDSTEKYFDDSKANAIRQLLTKTMLALAEQLKTI